jgi:Na+-driven multidrug efflux pump
LAAQSVSGKVGMVITMLAMGICMGMQPAISFNFASGHLERMYDILKKTSLFTLFVGTVTTILCFLARNAILTAFIDNAEVLTYGQIMVFASLCTGPFYGFYQLCQTFLQSTGKASYATFAALLDKGLFFIPILLLMNRWFGAYGIAFTGAVTLVFSILATALLSLHWNRQIRKKFL